MPIFCVESLVLLDVYITPDAWTVGMRQVDLHVVERVLNRLMAERKEDEQGGDEGGRWTTVVSTPQTKKRGTLRRYQAKTWEPWRTLKLQGAHINRDQFLTKYDIPKEGIHIAAETRTPYATELLDLDLQPWKSKTFPEYWDESNEKITTPAQRVSYMNHMILKNDGIRADTDVEHPTEQHTSILPSGVSVFRQLLSPDIGDLAFAQMKPLFTRSSLLRGPHILFLSKDPAIYISEAMSILRRPETQTLHDFIVQHIATIQNSTGASDLDIEAGSLTLVKYARNTGLTTHMDGITDFKHTFGPLFTINMDEGIKYLDLLPIATNAGDNSPSVRLCTKQFDITMMQGCARSGYGHGIPFGQDEDRYTIALKFPIMGGKFEQNPYQCDKFGPGAIAPTIIMRTPPPPQDA